MGFQLVKIRYSARYYLGFPLDRMHKVLKMALYRLPIALFLVLFKPSYQASSINSKSYIGAVVEYHPVIDGDNGQVVAEANAKRYRSIIEKASTHNVDIIVFPESGITSLPRYGPRQEQLNASEFRAFYRDTASYVPHPDESIVPCDVHGKYKKSLQSISCAARKYKIYVVVNHHERTDCPEPNCSPDGFLLYNTNVAFDRNGRVVARYRKYNLYSEDGTNVTSQPEYSTFTTDFGVTFGQLICADIYREKPAKFFVKNSNVTDVVFSTHWFNEQPFSDAVQHQAAWSYAADVNFLASNYNNVRTSSGGSGIYAGRNGPLQVYHSFRNSNALIIAEIPKYKNGKRVDDLQVDKPIMIELTEDISVTTSLEEETFERDYLSINLQQYSHETLNLRDFHNTTNATVCDKAFCCNFEMKIDYDEELAASSVDAKQYSYNLFAFNGVEGMEAANELSAGLQVCALIACAGNSLEDCGAHYPRPAKVIYPTKFQTLTITRPAADVSQRTLHEPSTMSLKNRLPLNGRDFSLVDDSEKLFMRLAKPQTDLMVFGIWTRRFDKDGQKPHDYERTTDEYCSIDNCSQ